MADFQLQLDVIAQTQKLEQGLKKAEVAVDKAVGKMDGGVQVANKGFDDLLGTVTKVAGGFFAIEGGFKLASAAASAFAGDAESAANALKSLPLIGPLVTSVYDFGRALEFASTAARKARTETAELVIALASANRELSRIERLASIEAELDALRGLSESQILFNKNRRLQNVLDEKLLVNQGKINDEFDRLIEAQEEASINDGRRRSNIAELNARREAALKSEEDLIQREKELLFLQVQRAKQREAEAEAIEEERRLAEKAEAEERERFQRQQERLRFEQELRKSIIEQREADAKAQEEAQRRQLQFVNARLKAEQEIAAARAEAEAQVAGATATFATAGGSFTTAVSATVNEQKLLTRISQQSRDFLAQIVANTARLGGLGFA